ncbi:hypothetical protein XSP_000579 [Xanthomonas euroxanthea]|uniref:Uncharacterized protein n=1 Tax=Xanthomonas euroxanthea TaxID=2259622 RepID=A0A8E4GDN5_9XANT|nr:hypothetical protein [Xanthomonas euroxanthea]CAD1787374.1 hypothetical protein XSP_000579 [Xanthomonas euroxanthea]
MQKAWQAVVTALHDVLQDARESMRGSSANWQEAQQGIGADGEGTLPKDKAAT